MDADKLNRDEELYLRSAVEDWIKAEFYFRLGPDCYSAASQDRLVKAEQALRQQLTGKKYLRNAAKRVGVPVKKIELLLEKRWKSKIKSVKPGPLLKKKSKASRSSG